MKKEKKKDYRLPGSDKEAFKIASIYFILGSIWILLSDRILESIIKNANIYAKVQTYKGWTFAMFSALLIYFLIYKREKIIRESFDQLTHSVFNDPLTSLPNKAAFLNYMNELTRKARAYNVVYINLDNFRFINDTLGHQVGDEYLSYIAKRLDSLRHKNEYLARLDGDEFGLLIPNYTKKEEVEARLDELTQDLDGHWCMENHQFFISFSAGIASWPKDGITSFDIYKHANIALNRAKKSGKKTRAFFEEVELADINERVKLANDLQRAIEEEEFFLHYQPLHELKTRQIGGVA